MSDPAEEAALARVPDLPQWIDTRGMLLTGRARVVFPPAPSFATDGFLVELQSRALLSVVDSPPAALILARALAMPGDVNVLCAPERADAVADALPGWSRHPVRLQAMPAIQSWEGLDQPDVTIFTIADAPPLDHLPDALRLELTEALAGYPSSRFVPGRLPARLPADVSPTPVPVAAAWIDGRPVAFCYPALETETLWDVSVETLSGYRGLGLAGRVARAMIGHMRRRGKAPVWGALEANTASLSVARRLGFAGAGRLAVLTPR